MSLRTRKPRSDAKLLNLPADLQDRLAGWLLGGLDYEQARLRAAMPEAEGGLGVQTSVGALAAFWREVVTPRLLEKRGQARDAAMAIAEEMRKDPGQWESATVEVLQQRAFELAVQPGVDPGDVQKLFGLVLKSRAHDLRERKLQLDSERMDLDRHRMAMLYLERRTELDEAYESGKSQGLSDDALVERLVEVMGGGTR